MNRLTLFGGVALDTGAGLVSGRAVQRHRVALLALLCTTRRLYRSRDQLVNLLWPDANAERGRKLLSDSIYRVNRALGGDAIVGTGEDVRLNRQRLSSDVADVEAALDASQWRRVVDHYTGPFLDGFYLPNAVEFDQWMELERAQHARAAAKALEALAVVARDAGHVAEAVDRWQQLALLVPDDSRVAMELMRALDAVGNRAGALRHARIHATLLHDSLGATPDRAVQTLADRIAAGTEVHRQVHRQVRPEVQRDAPRQPGTSDWGESRYEANVTPPRSAIARPGTSIAVLPFKNLSESDADSYLADGVAEELMYLLTRASGLRVAARTSVFAYRDRYIDVRDVGRELDVDWVLEGSVRRAGDRLRIAAQLVDARSGFQVWSASFDRTARDVMGIENEIVAAIAGRLTPTVSAESLADPHRLATRGVPDPEAYDLYLQARFHWHRRTAESLGASAKLFEQVVARAPEYARAWVGLADTYAVSAFYDYLAPRIANARADSAAKHAIQLDPTLAAPYATLAYVDTYYHWCWTAAEHGFRRAIELEPTYSIAHQWYGTFLTARGRFDEAAIEMQRAAELDPLSMVARSATGWLAILAGENERAIQQLGRVLQLDPSFQLAHYWIGLAFEQNGKPCDAILHLRRALELSNGSALVVAALAQAHASAGERDTARFLLKRLLSLEEEGLYVSSYEIAKVHNAFGETAAALDRLERAFADRAHSMALLNVDPQLRRLSNEPRFKRLVERVDQSL